MEEQGRAKTSSCIDFSLFPIEALEVIIKRFELGLAKYGRDNWQKGKDDQEFILSRANHALRHLFNYIHKINNDEDTDLDNLAAAGCNVAMLIALHERKKSQGHQENQKKLDLIVEGMDYDKNSIVLRDTKTWDMYVASLSGSGYELVEEPKL